MEIIIYIKRSDIMKIQLEKRNKMLSVWITENQYTKFIHKCQKAQTRPSTRLRELIIKDMIK